MQEGSNKLSDPSLPCIRVAQSLKLCNFFAQINTCNVCDDHEQIRREELDDSSMADRSNYGFYSIPSTLDSRDHKILGRPDNIPSRDHNSGNDTNGLPMDATTIRSRRKDRLPHQAQYKRWEHLVIARLLEVPALQWAVEEQFQPPLKPPPL